MITARNGTRRQSLNLGTSLAGFARKAEFLTDNRNNQFDQEQQLRREYVYQFSDRITDTSRRLSNLRIIAPNMEDLWLAQLDVPVAKQARLASKSFLEAGEFKLHESKRVWKRWTADWQWAAMVARVSIEANSIA